MNLSIVVLAAVFVLIAARGVGPLRLKMWQSMLAGALVVLVAGEITPRDALRAIDADVMLFLFGMFFIGRALVQSGLLHFLADRAFGRIRSSGGMLLAVIVVMGLASALLMNDTLAIAATPLMLRLAQEHRMDPKALLLALAFAVTVGSVMSPIGNPQNLLIAVRGGLDSPFATFLYALAVPTLINLFIVYLVLRVHFRSSFHGETLRHTPAQLDDPVLAALARLSLCILVGLIALKIVIMTAGIELEIRLSHIGIAAAFPLFLFSRRRLELLRGIDWGSLIFFAAMFVLMASVWNSGFFQRLMHDMQLELTAPPTVLGISLVLSQFISNVPLVALYLPLLEQGGAAEPALMALAAGSTVAGNVLLLGAASNIIIAQGAERGGVVIGFYEFARVGVPLALINAAVYGLYLYWLYGP